MSLLLHISPFLGDLLHVQPPPAARPPMRAELRAVPRPAPPPPLTLDKPAPESAARPPRESRTQMPKPAKPPRAKNSIPAWQQEIRRQFRKQQENGLFYPAEAIARGLEGDVLVFMLIDESGRVSAARVEQGSGQRLLDDAALKAVRSLHSLPSDAPREALVPVRFSLH